MSAHCIVRSAIAATASCLCLAAVPSRADEFSWQLSGGATRFEIDSVGAHTNTALLDATYYLDPVDDSNGPLALASFLHPTTRLSAEASDADATGDPKAYSLGGRYVLPGARWYAGADYAWSDVNLDFGPFFEQSGPKGYSLVGGRYFGDSTTLELDVGESKQTSRTAQFCQSVPPFCIGAITTESKTSDWSLDALHVGKLGSLTYSVGGGVRQSETDVDVTFAAPPGPVFVAPDSRRLNTYSVSGGAVPDRAARSRAHLFAARFGWIRRRHVRSLGEVVLHPAGRARGVARPLDDAQRGRVQLPLGRHGPALHRPVLSAETRSAPAHSVFQA